MNKPEEYVANYWQYSKKHNSFLGNILIFILIKVGVYNNKTSWTMNS